MGNSISGSSGVPTYYKADFCYPTDPTGSGDNTSMTYYNLIRNFQYNLKVTRISGNGSKTLADAIVGGREVDEGHDTLVVVLHEIVVEQSEVLGERWLQTRVTLRDVQRVAVICDIKQLRDAWLRSCTTIVHTQVAHL